jgi:membrane protein implicated in regulation of membrane protease activity
MNATVAFLSGVEYWHWFLAALALGILEVLFPGAIFVWFAAAAALLGAVVFLVPSLSWQVQLISFGLLSFAAIGAWRRFRAGHPELTDQPLLNRRAQQYAGKVLELVDPIENGYGKARLGDTVWTVRGPDAPAGCRVRVVGVDNTVLVVERDAGLP